jgi:hypothetical protein
MRDGGGVMDDVKTLDDCIRSGDHFPALCPWCNNLFYYDPIKGIPYIAVCLDCAAAKDEFIRQRVHAETGKIVGGIARC